MRLAPAMSKVARSLPHNVGSRMRLADMPDEGSGQLHLQPQGVAKITYYTRVGFDTVLQGEQKVKRMLSLSSA